MASSSNYLKKIAMVGIGGRSGVFITEALLKGGRHHITAITRPDSTNTVPDGVHDVKKVNYDDHASFVDALRGQDALIITMNVLAQGSQLKVVDAAIDAGVPWILPNEWGYNIDDNPQASKDTFLYEPIKEMRRHIESKGAGKTNWIGVACGFWYEFSLGGTEVRYGFDFPNKKLTIFDDGNVKINTSTWLQVGRAVAALLSLNIHPESDADKGICLEQFKNNAVRVSSFYVSQNDMFDSVLRVTGDTRSDWTVTHEDSKERYQRGQQMMQQGNMIGFAQLLYTRVFYPTSQLSNQNDKLHNAALGLPEEDLDEATKIGIDRGLKGLV